MSAKQKKEAQARTAPKKTTLKSSWQVRQKASREVMVATKLVGQIDLLLGQFKADGCSVALSEGTAVDKKLTQRLDGSIRWVYLGEDLDGTDEEAEIDQRAELLSTLRGYQHPVSSMVAAILCTFATEKKHSEHYGHIAFVRS